MNGGVGDEMDRMWASFNDEAMRLKDSFLALDHLVRWYKELDTDDQALADDVIADWLSSDSEAKRFDAVALIRQFKIKRAVPALQELSRRLSHQSSPGAPFEREKVDGLLDELG